MSATPALEAPRPALWPVLAAYLAAFVLALGASVAFVVAAVGPRTGWDVARLADEATRFALSAPGLLGAAFVDAAVLAGVTLVSARLMGPGVAARLRLGPTRTTAAGGVAAVLGMAGLSLACGSTVELLAIGHGGVMESLASALHSSSPLRGVLALLAIGVAPGVAEEGFFRGLLQTRLAARWGRWPAVVVSAAAFGLFHVDPVQGSLAFLAGLFLGWVADRLGGIRPTMVAHGLNNAMFVLFATQSSADDPGSRAQSAAILVAGAVTCLGAVAVLRSRWAVKDLATTAARPAS